MDKYKVINQLDVARFYLEKLTDSIGKAHEIVFNENYSVDDRYKLSATFLSLAEVAYLHYRGHQHSIELFGSEIESVDQSYYDYVFELYDAIKNKEDNLTWLQSRYEQFKKSSDNAIEAIGFMIKNNL